MSVVGSYQNQGTVTFTVVQQFFENPVISTGIHMMDDFTLRWNIFQHRFRNGFTLVMPIRLVDQQKAAWIENDFCVSCASYYTIDNRQ